MNGIIFIFSKSTFPSSTHLLNIPATKTEVLVKRILNFLTLLSFLSLPILAGSPAQAENPIIGQSCTDTQTMYRWTTSVRTAWSIGDLYAVPVWTTKPDEWSDANAFHQSLTAVLNQSPTAGDYAAACTSVWQQFFSDQADVIVLPQRTISVTIREVRCVSAIWSVVSEASSTNQDDIGWMEVGNQPFLVTDPSSTQSLASGLQALLDQLNNQPGANQSTVESYVKEQ